MNQIPDMFEKPARKLALIILFIRLTHLSFAADPTIWMVNNLDSIGGNPVTVYGNPQVINLENGKAVEFDGVDDGLLINTNPVAGFTSFTIEIVFNPYDGGSAEQRFLHIQQDDNNRILIELRSNTNSQWYIDTFIKSGSSSKTLVNTANLHSNNEWHTASLIYDSNVMKHYIDGQFELQDNASYATQNSGATSLGVRQNKVSWFKGAIKMVRFAPSALAESELWKGDGTQTSTVDMCSIKTNFSIQSIACPNRTNAGILRMYLNSESKLTLDIISSTGKVERIFKNKAYLSGESEIGFDTGHLAPGVYTARISGNGKVATKRFLVEMF